MDDNGEPIPLEQLIKRELLEDHYNEILEKLPTDNEYHDHLNHMVLSALIIDRKAKMPRDLKKRILHHVNWDVELKWRWKAINKEKEKKLLEERKKLIESFKQIIADYNDDET